MEILDFINTIKDKPKFLNSYSISYLTVMGSHAYGTANENSDYDYYGFCVPPLEVVFPYLAGEIEGFDQQTQRFNQYQGQHLFLDGKELDITIYSISRYFHLCADGNPNMIDSLFTDYDDCIKMDNVGTMIKLDRHLFLSQKILHTFTGMAFSHLNRLNNRERIGKRKETVEKYGYDVKDASHIVRLCNEIAQICVSGDLQLKFGSDKVLEVKQGLWKKEQVESYLINTVKYVDDLEKGNNFVIPYSPDMKKIKQLLINCIEQCYGSLSKVGFGKYANR